MDANQIKKAVILVLGLGIGIGTIGCGSATPGVSEGKSVVGTSDGGNNEGSTGGVTVTNIYSQPKELGVGDLLYVDLNSDSSLSFSDVSATSEFLFVLANTASSAGNFSVQISGDLSEPEFALEGSVSKSVD
ncbi:MAG: hypothetical protein U1D33_01160, partial [bacterium]|nr:hypothetical protein [bacterium]